MPQASNWLKRNAIILSIITVFSFLYSFIAITKYNHFQTSLDLAIYVQTFWRYAHFQLPYLSLYPTLGDLAWADHFTPSLFLLTPFFLFWQDPRMLLILQSTIFVLGAYPIFHFALERLNSKIVSLAIVFSYLLFFGSQFALTFDFHEAIIAASLFPWIFWCMFKKRWKLFFLLSGVALGMKEDVPAYIIFIGIYLFLSKLNRKLGLLLSATAFIYFIAVNNYIMPSLGHNYQSPTTAPSFSFEYLNPFYTFFNSPLKIKTMFLSFSNFLFLPLFSGYFLLLPFIHFFINFTSPGLSGRWDIYMHYRIYLVSIMAFATILGIENMRRKYKIGDNSNFTKMIAVIFFLIAMIFDYKLHLPLNTLGKPQFYHSDSWMSDLNTVIGKIPQNSSVATTNQLLAHVANRDIISFYKLNTEKLDDLEKYDFILVDLRPNQPVINFWYSEQNRDDLQKSIQYLLDHHVYRIYEEKNDALLIQKI